MRRARSRVFLVLPLLAAWACVGDDPATNDPSTDVDASTREPDATTPRDDGATSTADAAPRSDGSSDVDAGPEADAEAEVDAGPQPGDVLASFVLGGDGDVRDDSLEVTPDGGYLVGVAFTGHLVVGTRELDAKGNSDVAVVRLSKNLEVLWVSQLGSPGADAAVPRLASNGTDELAVVFWTKGPLKVGAASYDSANYQSIVARLNTQTGAPSWSHKLAGDYELKSQSIAYDGAGHVLVGGLGAFTFYDETTSYPGLGGYDAFTATYTSAGAVARFGVAGGTGNDAVPTMITRPAAAGVQQIVGYESNGVFDGTPLTGAGDLALRTLDGNGAGVGIPVVLADGPATENATSMSSKSTAIAVSGYYSKANAAAHIGGVTLAAAVGSANNGFVAMFGGDGSPRWAQMLSNQTVQGVQLLDDGSVLATSRFTGETRFAEQMLTSQGGYDALVTHWSATGALLWARTAGSALDDLAGATVVAPGQAPLVGMEFRGVVQLSGTTFTSQGNRDLVLLRLQP